MIGVWVLSTSHNVSLNIFTIKFRGKRKSTEAKIHCHPSSLGEMNSPNYCPAPGMPAQFKLGLKWLKSMTSYTWVGKGMQQEHLSWENQTLSLRRNKVSLAESLQGWDAGTLRSEGQVHLIMGPRAQREADIIRDTSLGSTAWPVCWA